MNVNKMDNPPSSIRSALRTLFGLFGGFVAGLCPGSILAMWGHDVIYRFITGEFPRDSPIFSISKAAAILAAIALGTLVGGFCGELGTRKAAGIAIRLCTPPKRFSLRGLFVFTACVAVVLSVVVVPLVRARGFHQERRTAAHELLTLGAEIRWRNDASPGLDGVSQVRLQGPRVDDAVVKRAVQTLQRCRNLHELDLSYSSVTDSSVLELTVLGSVEKIRLDRTRISDRSTSYLTQMKRLELISADNTSLSDVGIRELASLSSLRKVWVSNTRVSEDSVQYFKSTRPNIWIKR